MSNNLKQGTVAFGEMLEVLDAASVTAQAMQHGCKDLAMVWQADRYIWAGGGGWRVHVA